VVFGQVQLRLRDDQLKELDRLCTSYFHCAGQLAERARLLARFQLVNHCPSALSLSRAFHLALFLAIVFYPLTLAFFFADLCEVLD
jgi:hypothetical protein